MIERLAVQFVPLAVIIALCVVAYKLLRTPKGQRFQSTMESFFGRVGLLLAGFFRLVWILLAGAASFVSGIVGLAYLAGDANLWLQQGVWQPYTLRSLAAANGEIPHTDAVGAQYIIDWFLGLPIFVPLIILAMIFGFVSAAAADR